MSLGLHFIGKKYLEAKEELKIYEGTFTKSEKGEEDVINATFELSIALKDAEVANTVNQKIQNPMNTFFDLDDIKNELKFKPKVRVDGNKFIVGT